MSIFIQAHQDVFWGNSKSNKTYHFALTATPSHAISVDVVASIQGDTLQLSYFIENSFSMDTSNKPTLMRCDFLWEKTCLECFFDFGQRAYIELNFTPTGAFNLYHFDDYRTPNTLPPRWANGTVFAITGTPLDTHHVYHVGVKLDNTAHMDICTISPTAILYQDNTPYFYAIKHANPPDFHDKSFWQKL
ncbi:hypothetical protein [Moraxella oblonga]|uniref:hypothetical protein n=1 Tax=Moraxella oblonga TaxID=200413 RepID=UPI00082CFFA8|nr:hypothetical protein [Moraxella oblonga]